MAIIKIEDLVNMLDDPNCLLNEEVKTLISSTTAKISHADDIQQLNTFSESMLTLFKKYVNSLTSDSLLCKSCQYWERHTGVVDSPNGHCFCHQLDTLGVDFCSYHTALPRSPKE